MAFRPTGRIGERYLMNALDISKMLSTMHDKPELFSIWHGLLEHRPSGWRFKRTADGRIAVQRISESGDERLAPLVEQKLLDAWQAWEEQYWAPHIVDRHFGWCIRPGGFWRRFGGKLKSIWLKDRSDSAFVLYGRAWANIGQSLSGPDDEPPRGGRRQNHPKPTRPRVPVRTASYW